MSIRTLGNILDMSEKRGEASWTVGVGQFKQRSYDESPERALGGRTSGDGGGAATS